MKKPDEISSGFFLRDKREKSRQKKGASGDALFAYHYLINYSMIIPAPTVVLLPSSIIMSDPVFLLRRYSS